MYVGYFSDLDNVEYTVRIIPKGSSNSETEIKLSGSPVVLTQKSDGLFSEIKPVGCTIEILTECVYEDMYANGIHDVEVIILMGEKVIFEGYLTPYVYDQPFAHSFDTLQLEAVSKLSTLKDIDYRIIGSEIGIVSFKDLIWHLLVEGAGYNDDLIAVKYKLGVNERLSSFKISEANFFDNDDSKTPWKMSEVLENICKYLTVSCIEHENNIYLVDYQWVAKTNTSTVNYFNKQWFDDVSTTEGINGGLLVNNITKDHHISNDATISYDDIYNKVEVNVNTYNIENLSPKIEELQYSKNISGYPATGEWTHREYKWNGKIKNETVTWNTYNTVRLLNESSNWKHRYFKMQRNYSTGKCDEINIGNTTNPYYDPNSTSDYHDIWPSMNTRCAYIERFAKYDADDPTPTSFDWETYIVFNCLDDTTGASTSFNVNNWTDVLEAPVLEYTSHEALRYSPNVGFSWITIKGDLWYQRNTLQSDQRWLTTSIENKYIADYPVDGILDVSPYFLAHYSDWEKYTYTDSKKKLVKSWPTRGKSDPEYGKGYPMLKAKLQIGDKYWNGLKWTTTDSTFYINYNNDPKDGATEGFACFQWQTIAPNYDYTAKIDDRCWAIPIRSSDNVSGVLKFTLYTPSQYGPLFKGTSYVVPWYLLSPVVFMKGFELNYVYTDTNAWYLKEEKDDNDIVYANEVEAEFSRKYDKDIEMKINTYTDNVPISRSFVMYGDNNTFKTKFYNTVGEPDVLGRIVSRQMEYIHIEKLLDHYISKKVIYEASVKLRNSGLSFLPHIRSKIDFTNTETVLNDKNFVLDSYVFDLKRGSAKIKLVEW